MNQYFKAAAQRFMDKFNKQFHINPIGERDAEIITELKEILNKLGQNKVLAILKNYKFKEDQTILDELMQFNIDNPHISQSGKGGSEEGGDAKNMLEKLFGAAGKGKSDIWINLQENDLRLSLIYGYKKVIEGDRLYIKLNPVEEEAKKVPLYGNYLIEFYSEEELEEAIEIMRDHIEGDGGEFLFGE